VTTVARGRISSTSARSSLDLEQPRAGLGHHDRVDDDRRARGQELERARDGLGRGDRAEHADLDRVDAQVVDDGADLRDDHLRRDRLDSGDRHGVLGRDRGDRGRAVHAGAGERLEVGLDAGAAAGVRPGDRQADGDGARLGGHDRQG
jgi:hypothetical protein